VWGEDDVMYAPDSLLHSELRCVSHVRSSVTKERRTLLLMSEKTILTRPLTAALDAANRRASQVSNSIVVRGCFRHRGNVAGSGTGIVGGLRTPAAAGEVVVFDGAPRT
jgi:hypothetical protein